MRLVNTMDSLADDFLNHPTVRALERGEAAYVKRLKKMRYACRHAERGDIVCRAALVEFGRCVTAMAIEDEWTVGSLCTRFYICIEVLDPVEAELVCHPAIVACSNYLNQLAVLDTSVTGEPFLRD